MTKKNGRLTYAEINEQTAAFRSVNEHFDHIAATFEKVFGEVRPEEVIFTGCGTSLYLAQTSSAAFSYYNRISSKVVPCSELFFFPETYIKDKRVLVVPITRRSDTTEVKMAVRKAREYPNVKTLAVTCDEGSKAYNDYYVLSPNAKEGSIVMTKSFTSMLYVNVMMALFVAGQNDLLEQLKETPAVCAKWMDTFDGVARQIVEENSNLNLYITLGQGAFYGIANEAMNKIKEMAIANSEAYYSLEYRHGPMALADSNTLVTLLASDTKGEMEENLMKELKEIGAKIFMVGDRLSENAKQYADYAIELQCGFNDFQRAPLVSIAGQFIGYHAALNKGLDLDSPRNLAQAIIL
ncbi:MAG: SIS domain-containing protein [Firmicutes bacterium]|nr:SIS domain-containing protein [Bacillota bacterium]